MKDIITMDSPINKKLRIHWSKSPVSNISDTSDKNKPTTKPVGLWYGFGREWIDFVKTLDDESKNHWAGMYIYLVKILDLSTVLQLKTPEEIIEFTKKYNTYGMIPWRKVAKEYSGIEINPHNKKIQDYAKDCDNEFTWYMGWDIASGCIWDSHNIELKLIYPR